MPRLGGGPRQAFAVSRQVGATGGTLLTFPSSEFVYIRNRLDGHAPSVLGDMRRNPSLGRPGVASPAPTSKPHPEFPSVPIQVPESPSIRSVELHQAPFGNSQSPLPILVPATSAPSNQSDLTKQQVAAALGVSIRTLENWVRRHEFTPWGCGRVVRFDPSEVEQFRRRHRLSGPFQAAPAFHARRRRRRIDLPEGFGAAGGSEDGVTN